MWVSRKEFCKLKDEIEDLKRKHEKLVVDVADGRNFTVYGDKIEYVSSSYGLRERYASQKIAVKDVVQNILDRLGTSLVYVEGKPATVEMKRKK